MADPGPSNNPVPEPGMPLLSRLNRCQEQMARFTMLPEDYGEYDKMMNEYLRKDIQYLEFKSRMEALLLRRPQYAQLGVFWEVLHRGITGNVKKGDDYMILHPAMSFMLYNQFLEHVHEFEGDIFLPTYWQWKREWDCRRKPRYYTDGRLPINSPDPTFNPGSSSVFLPFIEWCQEQAARMTMRRDHFLVYQSITSQYGVISNELLVRWLRILVGLDPEYSDLLVYWNDLLRLNASAILLSQQPSCTHPLEICIRLHLQLFRAKFGKNPLEVVSSHGQKSATTGKTDMNCTIYLYRK